MIAGFVIFCPPGRAVDDAVPADTVRVILLLMALAWPLVALSVALVIGRAMREADRRALGIDHLAALPSELTAEHMVSARPAQPTH